MENYVTLSKFFWILAILIISTLILLVLDKDLAFDPCHLDRMKTKLANDRHCNGYKVNGIDYFIIFYSKICAIKFFYSEKHN